MSASEGGQAGAEVPRDAEAVLVHAALVEDRVRHGLASWLHGGPIQDAIVAWQELADRSAAPPRDRACEALGRCIEALRGFAAELHQPGIAHADLADAIETVAVYHAGRCGFAVSVDVDGRAAGALAPVVFSIAREAIVNAAKHAQARHVEVRVWKEGAVVRVWVRDDGRGFAVETRRGAEACGHLGLRMIEQRAWVLGGSASITSDAGHGTCVDVSLPSA